MPSAAMLSPVTVRYASGRHSSTPPGPSTLCAACTSTAPRQPWTVVLGYLYRSHRSTDQRFWALPTSVLKAQINSAVGLYG